ncbi:MAG: hypothetical protein ABL903_12005 [Methylococcales bacterium]
MSLITISNNTVLLHVKKYWFENVIFILLLFYTLFYFTPSSYGKALETMGIPNVGLIFGAPQAVRSDEWVVWTPYLQALVNNNFQRFNAYSIYHEDFRNFNALPIYDWALTFKPQFWSFLIAEPARAFSFHHGFLIATFIIGWKQFIAKILSPYHYASSGIAIGFSLLLFFSGFIQTTWTTMGPIIAFFPWLMLVLFTWKQNSISYYVLLTYVTTVWFLSHTYPPLVVSCAYLGILLLGAFQTNFFWNIKRCVFSLLACSLGVLIAIYYYKDAIAIMMDTVYPGKRISHGGEDQFSFWLSTIIPYITHSTDKTVSVNLNACEATAVSSLLPLISLCFADIKKLKDLYKKEALILSSAFLFFTAWMLFPVPLLIGKALLLTKIPGHRLVFILGLLVNIMALTLLVKYGAKLTLKRMIFFAALLFYCWNLPAIYGYFQYFDKSAIELLTVPLLAILLIVDGYQRLPNTTIVSSMVLIAALPNFLYFSTFNPIQSAQPIFSAKNSEVVQKIKTLEQEDSRGWLIFSGVPGAILNGLGLKSFAHVLIQPQLDFFRKMFPDLPAEEFNQIFNRYAHVQLHDIQKPESPALDVIKVPIKQVFEKRRQRVENITHTPCNINSVHDGNLDTLVLHNNILYLSGWAMSSEHRYLTNLKTSELVNYIKTPRLDIATAKKDKELMLSGFNFEIKLSEADISLMHHEGFCLFSESRKYGVNELIHYSAKDINSFMSPFKK